MLEVPQIGGRERCPYALPAYRPGLVSEHTLRQLVSEVGELLLHHTSFPADPEMIPTVAERVDPAVRDTIDVSKAERYARGAALAGLAGQALLAGDGTACRLTAFDTNMPDTDNPVLGFNAAMLKTYRDNARLIREKRDPRYIGLRSLYTTAFNNDESRNVSRRLITASNVVRGADVSYEIPHALFCMARGMDRDERLRDAPTDIRLCQATNRT